LLGEGRHDGARRQDILDFKTEYPSVR
jgi:hypothetical protein